MRDDDYIYLKIPTDDLTEYDFDPDPTCYVEARVPIVDNSFNVPYGETSVLKEERGAMPDDVEFYINGDWLGETDAIEAWGSGEIEYLVGWVDAYFKRND